LLLVAIFHQTIERIHQNLLTSSSLNANICHVKDGKRQPNWRIIAGDKHMVDPYNRDGQAARDRHHELLAESAEWRLANETLAERRSVVRASARWVGRRLVRLGARLLSYGRAEGAIVIHLPRPTTRSAQLN
jgi:hypothetical protein